MILNDERNCEPFSQNMILGELDQEGERNVIQE